MLNNVLNDGGYRELRAQTAEMARAWHSSLEHGEMSKLDSFKKNAPAIPQGSPSDPSYFDRVEKFTSTVLDRQALAKRFIQEMVYARHPKLQKSGLASTTGFNFYDLRGPAFLIYPVNVYFRNTLPRVGKVNDGYGIQANWKGNRNPGVPYAGASEGNRGAVGTPDEIDYFAKYKEIGVEGSVTYTAEFAGEGYTDNLADEHLRDLHRIFLQEEGMLINGNSGAGGSSSTGFKLGTPSTPTGAAGATHTVGTAGNLGTIGNADLPYTTALTNGQYVSVSVVALTAMGNPANNQYGYGILPTIASGLTPQYNKVNADGSIDIVNGGTSIVSALSSATQATTSNLTVKFTTKSIKGAYGYAWYVDVEGSNTQSAANALFAGITTVPFCYVSGTPNGTQAMNFTNGSLANLSTDCSFNTLDFDGLLTYAASTTGAYYNDLLGGTFTSQKNGRVTEVENALQYIWANYQAGVDEIWGSYDAVANLDAAIRYSGTQVTGFQFVYNRSSQNDVLGGFVVSGYQSRYAFNSATGANVIPIRIHPMIPPGTLYYHIKTNPYPQSRLPWVAAVLVQRDYYSIEWPQTSRKWPFGTYAHEVLAHSVPWIPGVQTGIGPFVGS